MGSPAPAQGGVPDEALTQNLADGAAEAATTRGRRRRRSLGPDGFYGRRIVVFASVALALTAPGQTAAVSAFIDPLIRDLHVSRSAISTAYLVGTLSGAAAMPWIGQALDRFGVRRTMAAIGAVFGAVLVGMSLVSDVVGLTAGFVGIRLAGQGALGLTATTSVALWFSRRRGTALGLVSSIGAAGISLAPIGLERLIAAHGWRTAWTVEGFLIWATVIPLALLGMRDRPEQLGQRVDGAPPHHDSPTASWGLTRGQAMATPYFWIVSAAVATTGMLSTAIGFHQISLLGEHGLTTTQAAANFLPQTLAALFATLGTGVLIDRVNARWAIVVSMITMAAGLAWGTVVTPGWSAIGFGICIGAAGGAVRSLEAATFPRYFGTAHIGSVRGVVTALSVGSTAFGPVLFAVIHDASGGYGVALLSTMALPVVVAAAAIFVRPPHSPPADVRAVGDAHAKL